MIDPQHLPLKDSLRPFWGSPTSHANFCEEDYIVTRYVAEFINSLTNVAYLIYAVCGIYKLRQKPTAHTFRTIPYWGLLAVGMMDDVSMLFATTPVLHRVLTVNVSRRNSITMAILLSSFRAARIAYHLVTDELVLHHLSFAVMVITIGIRTMQLIHARTATGSLARSQLWGMVRFGAFIFNAGFYIWVIERWTCAYLRSARKVVGLPWAWLLELHGYWHIFTAIGAYIFIAVVDHLVSAENHVELERSFAWPASWAARSTFASKQGGSIERYSKRYE